MRGEGLEVVTVEPRVLAREGICAGISASLSHFLATQICSEFHLEAFPNYMAVSEPSSSGCMTPARAAPLALVCLQGRTGLSYRQVWPSGQASLT